MELNFRNIADVVTGGGRKDRPGKGKAPQPPNTLPQAAPREQENLSPKKRSRQLDEGGGANVPTPLREAAERAYMAHQRRNAEMENLSFDAIRGAILDAQLDDSYFDFGPSQAEIERNEGRRRIKNTPLSFPPMRMIDEYAGPPRDAEMENLSFDAIRRAVEGLEPDHLPISIWSPDAVWTGPDPENYTYFDVPLSLHAARAASDLRAGHDVIAADPSRSGSRVLTSRDFDRIYGGPYSSDNAARAERFEASQRRLQARRDSHRGLIGPPF